MIYDDVHNSRYLSVCSIANTAFGSLSVLTYSILIVTYMTIIYCFVFETGSAVSQASLKLAL